MSKLMMSNSIVGYGSHFKGRFLVRGSLKIEGKFIGETIEVDHIFIGSNGEVQTNIYANNVEVEGLVVGNIEATSRVFLRPTSRVLGDIKTKELIIQNGVVLEGKCIIGNDEKQVADLKRVQNVDPKKK